MSDKVTFSFATPSLTTLKANFIAEASGQIVRASNGSMLANNSTNRPLASIVGAWNAGLGQYTFTMPADAPNGNYRAKIWFNPTWVDDEPDIGETNILTWDGADLTDTGETDTPADDSLTFNFELKLDGVLSDADDPPTLSDSTAVYGIKRLDTGEVVVPAGTELIHDGTGLYSYTITEPVAGVTYRAAFKYVVDGDTLYFEKEETANGGGAEWTYSSQTPFDLWNDSDNTALETSRGNSTTTNSDVLQAAGDRGDTYIDSVLASYGWTVPLTGMDDRTTKLLTDISNHAARWQLADARQFGLYTGQSLSVADESALGLADKKYVDMWLERIKENPEILGADGGPSAGLGDLIIPGPEVAGATVDAFGNTLPTNCAHLRNCL